jgi:hypothetical protein
MVAKRPPVCSSCHAPARKTGNADLADERARCDRVAQLGAVEGVGLDLGEEVRVLQAQLLVGGARAVAGGDPVGRPLLTLRRSLVHPVLGPVDREAGVQQPSRVQNAAIAVVDDGQGP